ELQLTYLENELQITLEDNGVGMGEVQLKTKGIVFRNVKGARCTFLSQTEYKRYRLTANY
ncbi:MAG: hypothetical protein AAGI49_09660, partial [Bacteroidota bacterium]